MKISAEDFFNQSGDRTPIKKKEEDSQPKSNNPFKMKAEDFFNLSNKEEIDNKSNINLTSPMSMPPDVFFNLNAHINDDGKTIPSIKSEKTQEELIQQYAKSHPAYFEDGVLVDKKGAEEAGIIEIVDYATDENTQINMPLAPELHSIRYRDKDELIKYKEAQARLNMPLRDKSYVDVKTQTEAMLKQDLSNRPFMRKYRDVFGEAGLNVLAVLKNAFTTARGAFADGYQYVHEAIDEFTDGGATKTIQMSPRTAAKRFTGDIGQLLESAEAVPFVRLTAPVKTAAEMSDQLIRQALKEKKQAIKMAVKNKMIENRKFNVKGMKNATQEASIKAKKKASDKAKKNLKIKEDLIKGFEQKIGARSTGNIDNIIDESKIVSKISAGRLILDPNKARTVGRSEAKKIYDEHTGIEVDVKTGKSIDSSKDTLRDDLDMFGIDKDNTDRLANPILDAETLDPLVAIVSDLKKKYPGSFGKGETLIDDLFRVTIEKKLEASDELADLLAKYDLSLEKYILATVGSGSDAGKTLQKFAAMKKARTPAETLEQLKLNKELNGQALGWKYFLRFVNIGRGLMVSQIATMMRNVRSALYRAPMEGLGQVMDNTLYRMGDIVTGKGSLIGSAYRGINEFFRPTNWSDSFRHMKYMYDDLSFKDGDLKEFTNWILDRPEFAGDFNRLFNTLNEIQTATGRGQATSRMGKAMDGILSGLEDLTDFLNIPNRWQEHIIRRSYFAQGIENLVKKEYGLDFVAELKKGKFKDFMNNSTSVKPKGARDFQELITDAVENALRNTYAAKPEFKPFAGINNFITRTGLTVLVAFPRFMFTSMELMAKYSSGALLVPIKRALGLVGLGVKKQPIRDVFRRLDANDRDMISKNIIGLGALYGMMEYGKSEYSHPDYKKIKMSDGKVIDSTPEFPVRPLRHLAAIGNKFLEGYNSVEGTKEEKTEAGFAMLGTTELLDAKELAESFLGNSLRTGRDFTVISDFAQIVGDGDIVKAEKMGKFFGSPLGNFAQRYFVPVGMVQDAERALGIRTPNVKEYASETDLTFYGSFKKSFLNPLQRRGLMSPKDEANLEDKVYAFDRDGKKRVNPELKVLAGLSFYEDDPPPADFFKEYGFTTFGLSSKAGSVIVRNRENKLLSLVLPTIAEIGKTTVLQNDSLDDADPEKLNKIDLRKKIRNFIDRSVKKSKVSFGEAKYFFEDDPNYTDEIRDYKIKLAIYEKSLTRFRRTRPLARVEAVRLFKRRFKRDVELTPTYSEDIKDSQGKVLFKKGDINMDLDLALKLEKGETIKFPK